MKMQKAVIMALMLTVASGMSAQSRQAVGRKAKGEVVRMKHGGKKIEKGDTLTLKGRGRFVDGSMKDGRPQLRQDSLMSRTKLSRLKRTATYNVRPTRRVAAKQVQSKKAERK